MHADFEISVQHYILRVLVIDRNCSQMDRVEAMYGLRRRRFLTQNRPRGRDFCPIRETTWVIRKQVANRRDYTYAIADSAPTHRSEVWVVIKEIRYDSTWHKIWLARLVKIVLPRVHYTSVSVPCI